MKIGKITESFDSGEQESRKRLARQGLSLNLMGYSIMWNHLRKIP